MAERITAKSASARRIPDRTRTHPISAGAEARAVIVSVCLCCALTTCLPRSWSARQMVGLRIKPESSRSMGCRGRNRSGPQWGPAPGWQFGGEGVLDPLVAVPDELADRIHVTNGGLKAGRSTGVLLSGGSFIAIMPATRDFARRETGPRPSVRLTGSPGFRRRACPDRGIPAAAGADIAERCR